MIGKVCLYVFVLYLGVIFISHMVYNLRINDPNGFQQIDMGCGNHPEINRNQLRRAHPANGTLLQHPRAAHALVAQGGQGALGRFFGRKPPQRQAWLQRGIM